MLPKVAQKVATAIFLFKSDVFQICPKWDQIFGLLLQENFLPEFIIIAQSSHLLVSERVSWFCRNLKRKILSF